VTVALEYRLAAGDNSENSPPHQNRQGKFHSPRAVREAKRLLRLEFLHECASGIAVHAGLVQTFAELGDTAGTCYALRRPEQLSRGEGDAAMTRGISAKEQREDRLRLRRKRLQDASGALQGAKSPRPGRPSVGLPAHRYPITRSSLGRRQGEGPA
jgi:hypothetical protein